MRFCQVRCTPQEALFNWLIESEHYLGYTRAVGEHLKFMVYAGGSTGGPLCLELGGAAPGVS